MADVHDAGYLSIGEVLGLLLEEFPDITISKIRFLESQGLISPERTASGYRKFYEDDVELLRVILTEQRQNYLPLRVIKDRLQTGEIDPTGEHLRPDDDTGDEPATEPDVTVADINADVDTDVDRHDEIEHDVADVPAARVAAHPASRGHQSPDHPAVAAAGNNGASDLAAEPVAAATQLLPGVLLDRAELCGMVGMSEAELEQLESFGIIASPRRRWHGAVRR